MSIFNPVAKAAEIKKNKSSIKYVLSLLANKLSLKGPIMGEPYNRHSPLQILRCRELLNQKNQNLRQNSISNLITPEIPKKAESLQNQFTKSTELVQNFQDLKSANWQYPIQLENLKKSFTENDQVQWSKWESFKKNQPGFWIKIPRTPELAEKWAENKVLMPHELKSVRVLFLKAQSPEPVSTKIYFGGIGFDIERALKESPQFIESMNLNHHLLFIEKGGLTDLEDYFQRISEPEMQLQEVIDDETEMFEDFTSLEIMRELLQSHEIAAPQKSEIMALSMGGWKLIELAAHPIYSQYISEINLLDPGGQSLDEHFYPFLKSSRQVLKSVTEMNQQFSQNLMTSTAFFYALMGLDFQQSPLAPQMSSQMNSINLSKLDLESYALSVESIMKKMFPRLGADELRLKYAVARVAGMRDVDAIELIQKIPPHIKIRLWLGGEDDIVPPSMFADMIEALKRREKQNSGKFSVYLVEGLGHDAVATTDHKITNHFEDAVSGYSLDENLLIHTDGKISKISVEDLINQLRSATSKWINKNIHRENNRENNSENSH